MRNPHFCGNEKRNMPEEFHKEHHHEKHGPGFLKHFLKGKHHHHKCKDGKSLPPFALRCLKFGPFGPNNFFEREPQNLWRNHHHKFHHGWAVSSHHHHNHHGHHQHHNDGHHQHHHGGHGCHHHGSHCHNFGGTC